VMELTPLGIRDRAHVLRPINPGRSVSRPNVTPPTETRSTKPSSNSRRSSASSNLRTTLRLRFTARRVGQRRGVQCRPALHRRRRAGCYPTRMPIVRRRSRQTSTSRGPTAIGETSLPPAVSAPTKF
jgi:hypothetical protein